MKPKYNRTNTVKDRLNHYSYLLNLVGIADEQLVHATQLMDILEKRGKFP